MLGNFIDKKDTQARARNRNMHDARDKKAIREHTRTDSGLKRNDSIQQLGYEKRKMDREDSLLRRRNDESTANSQPGKEAYRR